MANYYIGMSLSPSSTIETGVVVLDNMNNLILVDKLFSMSDVQFFFENFSSLKQSKVCVSLPWDNTLMTGKWRILSKPYQMVTTHKGFLNLEDWLDRYSYRGCDCINRLIAGGADIKRFDLYLSRLKLNLYSNFKQRSPADCKFLQSILKTEYGFSDIPTNMMPAGALEAMVGALIARAYDKGETEVISNFAGVDVINVLSKRQ